MTGYILLLFPLLLTVGVLTIPHVHWFGDHISAENAAQKTSRWQLGHLLTASAFGIGIASIVLLSQSIARSTNTVFSFLIVMLAAIGGGLLAAGLGADGIGPTALLKAGQSATLFFDGSRRTVPITFVFGTLLFGASQLLTVILINQQQLLPTWQAILIMLAAIAFAALSAIPSSWSLYLLALVSWLLYLPIFFVL